MKKAIKHSQNSLESLARIVIAQRWASTVHNLFLYISYIRDNTVQSYSASTINISKHG